MVRKGKRYGINTPGNGVKDLCGFNQDGILTRVNHK